MACGAAAGTGPVLLAGPHQRRHCACRFAVGQRSRPAHDQAAEQPARDMSGERGAAGPALSGEVLRDWRQHVLSELAQGPASLPETRRQSELEAQRAGGPGEPVAAVEEVDIGHARCRVYRPAGHESAALVWLHGGGWTQGSVAAHDPLARRLANRSRGAVVSVGYRLAPEHPYPAAVDDAWHAIEWATRRWDLVAVGGDSAGGNLAAAVAQRARRAR